MPGHCGDCRGQVGAEAVIAVILVSFVLLFSVLMNAQMEDATTKLDRALYLENKCNNFSEVIATVFYSKDSARVTLTDERDFNIEVDANSYRITLYSTAFDANNYCNLSTKAVISDSNSTLFTIGRDQNSILVRNVSGRVVINAS